MPTNAGVPIDAEKLRLARLRKGWTLREVSDRTAELGRRVGFGDVARYERGLRQPYPWILQIVAEALDVDIADLIKKDAAA